MEKLIGATIPHQSKSINLISQLDLQLNSPYLAYFITNIPDLICLVAQYNSITSAKPAYSLFNQLDRCSNKQFEGAVKKYDEIGNFNIDGKKYAYALYLNMRVDSSIDKVGKWMSESDILELAHFLFELVVQFKKNQIYFGSLRPSRIFQASSGINKFVIIGGEFSHRSGLTSKEYLSTFSLLKIEAEQFQYYGPEIVNQKGLKEIGYKTDMFSVSFILYELIFENYPFFSKQDLLNGHIQNIKNQDLNAFPLLRFLITRILSVPNPHQRPQPEQVLHLIEQQKTQMMFKTQRNTNLLLNKNDESSSLSILQNIQDFFVKCTKQTQGWILHYCESSSQSPDQKFLENLLIKLYKKSEKSSKVVSSFEKISNNCTFQQGLSNKSGLYDKEKEITKKNLEQSNWVAIKLGIMILNLLRKSDNASKQKYLDPFKKIGTKMLEKNPRNSLIVIIFKIICMKTLMHEKVKFYNGNFSIEIEQFQSLSIKDFEYLSQYSLKVVNYVGKFTQQNDESLLNGVERLALTLICDQLYDSTSAMILGIMALRKDIVLNIKQMDNLESEAHTLQNCKKLLNQIEKLSYQSLSISSHALYSILSDYYAYQEEICLIYEPIITSYEYFLLDNPQFKGLKVPKDYPAFYLQIKDQEKYQMFKFRNLIKEKSKIVGQNPKEKAKTNIHMKDFENWQEGNMKSEGSKIANPASQEKISTQVNISQKKSSSDSLNFPASLTFLDSPSKNKSECSEKTTPSERKQQKIDEDSFDFLSLDIHSYQWLKNTQQVITKMFKKPELDANIHYLYDLICNGLKLQELKQFLGKHKKFIIDPSQVLFQKVIGSGSAGQVYIGKYHNEVVAIKKVKTTTNPMALKEFEREVLTYLKIKSHPFLVSLVGLTKYNQDYFLLTEFCEGGSLFDLLHKKVDTIALSWNEKLKLIKQTALGMKFLHDMNPPIIHRDLKSLNVFITKVDGVWTAKVADFGLSRCPDANLMTSALGTLHWMAPQLLCNKQYSIKVDIYSFAIVMWEICARKTPYHTLKNPMEIVKHVLSNKGRPELSLIGEGCPKEIIELMKRCWSEKPEDRPIFEQIILELQKIKM